LKGLGVQFYFEVRSLIVSAWRGHVQQLEAQLVMRNYEGLLARGGCAAGGKGEEQGGPDTRHPDKLDRAVIFLGPPGAGKARS